MKKLILIVSAIFFSNILFSQDTIVKYNGDKIAAKVSEITNTEIKYKKFNFLDGPMYVEKKSNIEMIKFSNGLKEYFEKPKVTAESENKNNHSNDDYYGAHSTSEAKIIPFGTRFQFKNQLYGERDIHDILMHTNDKKIMALVQQSKDNKKLQYVGFVAIPLGIAAVYCFAKSQSMTYNPGTGRYSKPSNASAYLTTAGVCFIAGISCPIASGVFKHRRTEGTRDAIRLYNEKY